MQVCKADISINGDRNSVVCNKEVTVAEIVLLRQIHGEQGVANIRPTEQDKRTSAFEIARLKRVYRSKAALIDEVFGKVPRLPTNLEDIGVEHPAVEEARAKSGKPSRSRAKSKTSEDATETPSAEQMSGETSGA